MKNSQLLMEWNDRLDIGVDHMNHQHQYLLDLMNQLYVASTKNSGRQKIITLIESLKTATVDHFKEEEEFMLEIEFEGLESHKRIHVNLLEKFESHRLEFVSSENETLDPKFFQFLKFWLSAHIQGIDAKYGEHATAHSKKAI